MTGLVAFLTIIGALIGLAGVGGGLYAVVRSSARDATEKRLRAENEDYLRRLNYVEPRMKTLEEQNELLLQLHNPTSKLDSLSGDHQKIVGILQAQGKQLHQIHDMVAGREK